jgi:hypothetical protein
MLTTLEKMVLSLPERPITEQQIIEFQREWKREYYVLYKRVLSHPEQAHRLCYNYLCCFDAYLENLYFIGVEGFGDNIDEVSMLTGELRDCIIQAIEFFGNHNSLFLYDQEVQGFCRKYLRSRHYICQKIIPMLNN